MDDNRSALFTPLDKNSARALCMGAGDWSLLVASEVERILTQQRNRRPAAFAEGFQELVRRGAITSNDAGVLEQLTNCLFEKADLEACRTELLACYRKLWADADASPAAIAIASTAVRLLDLPSAQPAPGSPVIARAASAGGAVAFGIAGAVIGAGIGAGFGGPIGAGVGGLIGGAVGVGISISNSAGV